MNPLSKLPSISMRDLIDSWKEILRELRGEDMDDPYAGYIAADYYDGENVYLYKPDRMAPLDYEYKIDWDSLDRKEKT